MALEMPPESTSAPLDALEMSDVISFGVIASWHCVYAAYKIDAYKAQLLCVRCMPMSEGYPLRMRCTLPR
jgi:hypothetical protein